MAAITGDVSEISIGGSGLQTIELAALPGRSAALAATRSALGRRFYALKSAPDEGSADTHVDVTPLAGPGGGGVKITGDVSEAQMNTGLDWFEKIHIYPDSVLENPSRREKFKMQLGSVLGDTTRQFELYNAYRRTVATINSLTNNLLPGITIPDLTPPTAIAPQASYLDSSSPVNTDGSMTVDTTKILDTVAIDEEGLSVFDNTLVFVFDVGDMPFLELSGTRVSIINAPRFESPFNETFEFYTRVLPSANGKEQRIAGRESPREIFEVNYFLDGLTRQRMQALLFDWQDKVVGFPRWDQERTLTADSSIGSTQFQVAGADGIDLRVGGLVYLYKDELTVESFVIASLTSTVVTVTNQSQKEFNIGDKLMPMMTGYISNVPKGARHKVLLENFALEITAIDETVGAPAGSSTDWNSSTHNSRIFLDECNVISGETSEESFERKVVVIDNSTGRISQGSQWNKTKRISQKTFSAKSTTQVTALKALLRYLRGQQVAFYIPTFIEDMTAAAAITVGTAILDIERIEYTKFIAAREPKKRFRITYSDGTTETKVISSSTDHPTDPTLERLTLTTTWGASHDLVDIGRIEFIELVRFATDRFTLRHERIGLASLSAPVITVFDDD